MGKIKRLEQGNIGVMGAIAQEIAAMAPACDTVAFMTAAAIYAYVLTPLSFLLAMAVMYLEVNTLYHLSKRHASAGGYYGYVATAYGPSPAVLTGFLYIMYQVASTAAIPTYIGGVVLPGALKYFFNINIAGWLWIPLILIFIIIPIMLAILGIKIQMKYIKAAALFEISFLFVLSLIIILKAPDNTLNVFNPFAWPNYKSYFDPNGGPVSSVGLGMIFAITSFIGYGGSAPLGEEVKSHRSITKALVIGLLITGGVLTEVSYSLVVGWGVNHMAGFAHSAIPGILVATFYTGIAGGLMLSLVALNSAFSDSVAMQSNAARVYFAMARDHILPDFFSDIHKKFKTPYKSLLFIGASASIVALTTGFIMLHIEGVGFSRMFSVSAANPKLQKGLTETFAFLTTIALYGLIITHFLLNTSIMVLYKRLKEKHHGLLRKIIHPIEHYVMPGLATLIFMFVLYESVIPPLFPIFQASVVSILFICIIIIYIMYLKKYRKEILAKVSITVNLIGEEGCVSENSAAFSDNGHTHEHQINK
jgi:amino acid transporter